jgi:hypothetical protein
LPEQINCGIYRADRRKTIFYEGVCAIQRHALPEDAATFGGCSEKDAYKTLAAIADNNPDTEDNLLSMMEEGNEI